MSKKGSSARESRVNLILQKGGCISSITFTSDNPQVFEGVLQDLSFDGSNCFEADAKVGNGILSYKGASWVNGGIFLGTRQAVDPTTSSKPSMLKFLGMEGQEALEKIFTLPKTFEKLMECKVNSATLLVQVRADSSFPGGSFLEDAKIFKENCENSSRTGVFINQKGIVSIGRKSNIKSLDVGCVGNNVLLELTLQTSAAAKFVATAAQSGNRSSQATGLMAWEFLRDLPFGQFGSKLSDLLKDQLGLSSVRSVDNIVASGKKKKALSKEMARVKASCTSIVNKLKTANSSPEAQEVFLEHCIQAIFKERGVIPDYTLFVEQILKKLGEKKT
jgi:hypothetical protein